MEESSKGEHENMNVTSIKNEWNYPVPNSGMKTKQNRVLATKREEAAAAEPQTHVDEDQDENTTSSLENVQWIMTRKRWRRADGVRAFPPVFHALLEAYARAGEWQRAVDCLDDMAYPGDEWAGKEKDGGDGR